MSTPNEIARGARKALGEAYARFRKTDIFIIARLILIFAIFYFVYNYWRSFVDYVSWLLTPEPDHYKAVAPWFAVGAITMGFLLYWLRSASRIRYGIIEILFGTVGIAFSASTMTQTSYQTSLVQLAAGTYIIVRGLDNVKAGLDANPTHRLWFIWLLFSNAPLLAHIGLRLYYTMLLNSVDVVTALAKGLSPKKPDDTVFVNRKYESAITELRAKLQILTSPRPDDTTPAARSSP